MIERRMQEFSCLQFINLSLQLKLKNELKQELLSELKQDLKNELIQALEKEMLKRWHIIDDTLSLKSSVTPDICSVHDGENAGECVEP